MVYMLWDSYFAAVWARRRMTSNCCERSGFPEQLRTHTARTRLIFSILSTSSIYKANYRSMTSISLSTVSVIMLVFASIRYAPPVFFEQAHTYTHSQDRYDQMLPVMRIWRHIKMVKRAGRGHDPKGVANTKMGQCAVECPACPNPRWNLPKGWENVPAHKK